MTRKDYVAIAQAINNVRSRALTPDAYTVAYNNGVDAVASELLSTLANDNPRFDRERFLKAAGVPS